MLLAYIRELALESIINPFWQPPRGYKYGECGGVFLRPLSGGKKEKDETGATTTTTITREEKKERRKNSAF